DAAFAYYVAGYYARAANFLPSAALPSDVPTAQKWLSTFLAKNFRLLDDETRQVVDNDRYSDQGICQDLVSGDLVKQKAADTTVEAEIVERVLSRVLAECLSDFLTFVKQGHQGRLDRAYRLLEGCERLAVKVRDSVWWWRLICTRFVLEEFRRNSLWSCLEFMRTESGADEVVSRYISANYERDNPVV
ncbi:MAG: hypothetical protein AAB393_14570, partial [Bacteroidota bacterium]